MKVLIIGSHGKVGKRLVKKLSSQNHEVIAMIRDESQRDELKNLGATPVVANLESDLSPAFSTNPDAVIFTAGSGAHTGEDKTMSVDMRGAQRSIDEAVKHNVGRYIMVSALATDDKDRQPESMKTYYTAKSEADQYLVQSELDYTIFRPGRLLDETGNGSISAAERLDDWQSAEGISRDNLATAITYSLDKRNTHKKVIELLNGNTPVPDAIDRI